MDEDEERIREEGISPSEEEAREEDFVSEETDAAGEEAAAIGGDVTPMTGDQARRAVEEAGGGQAEGFEQAERELIRRASHEGDAGPDPETHQGRPEPDRSDAEYGEADDVQHPDA